MRNQDRTSELPETKRKLVDAGVRLMRARGFNATSVDEICAAAGVTKGGFFHYFKSKEEVAKAAVQRFSEGKSQEFQEAPFRKLADPLDRVYGRLDFITESADGATRLTKGCLIGTFAQELSFTHPELRSACQASFLGMAKDFEADLAEAKSVYAPEAEFSPKSLATLFVSIFQGSYLMAKDFEADLAEAKSVYAPEAEFSPKGLATLFVSIFQGSYLMAKAFESNAVLVENLEEFRRHLQNLFGQTHRSPKRPSAKVPDESRN